MERYIVEKKNDKFILKEEQVHQIVKVMRNRIGDKITLVHDGIFSICEIVSLKKYNVVEVYLDYNNYLQFYDKYNVLESAFEEKVVLTLAVDDIELETIKDYNYKIIGERLL